MVFVSYIGITKIGQERPVKGHHYGFFRLIFPNLGYLERYTSLYACFFFEVLIENKGTFYETGHWLK